MSVQPVDKGNDYRSICSNSRRRPQMIFLYKAYCPYCVAAFPAWDEATRKERGADWACIDATAHPGIATLLGATMYPTFYVKVFESINYVHRGNELKGRRAEDLLKMARTTFARLYYSPGSASSVSFAPAWEAVKAEVPSCRYSMVNVNSNPRAAKKNGVVSTPAVHVIDTSGMRQADVLSLDSLKALLQEQKGPLSSPMEEVHDKVSQHGKALVFFYAPWCGFCKKLKPAWEEVQARISNPNICKMINIIEFPSVPDEEAVLAYPTIRLYTQQGTPRTHEGGRDAESIIAFAEGEFTTST